jgi:iron complex transport system permease protein
MRQSNAPSRRNNAPSPEGSRNERQQYEHLQTLHWLSLLGLGLVLIFLICLSITIGPFEISIAEAFRSVVQTLFGGDLGVPDVKAQIVMKLRAPRAFWAVVAGMGFGLTGALMQTVLRNPLASPFTLGISAGANFGVAVAIVLGIDVSSHVYGIIGNAFFFALLTSLLILAISSLRGATVQILVLAGIGLNYILRAGGNMLEYLATPEQLESTRAFSRGELGAFGYSELLPVSIVMLAGMLLMLPRILDLNVMAAGDERAESLGIRAGKLRIFVMLVASCMVAAIVAFVGPIGFVGLAGPHIARSFAGVNHKILLPASALIGAIILLCADLVGMNILGAISIPVGVMTSLVGVPFFLYFIFKERRRFW